MACRTLNAQVMPKFNELLSDLDVIAVLSHIKSQWPENMRWRHDQVNAIYAFRSRDNKSAEQADSYVFSLNEWRRPLHRPATTCCMDSNIHLRYVGCETGSNGQSIMTRPTRILTTVLDSLGFVLAAFAHNPLPGVRHDPTSGNPVAAFPDGSTPVICLGCDIGENAARGSIRRCPVCALTKAFAHAETPVIGVPAGRCEGQASGRRWAGFASTGCATAIRSRAPPSLSAAPIA